MSLLGVVRRAIQVIEGDALFGDILTMPQVFVSQLRKDRKFATVSRFLALLTLVRGAIGSACRSIGVAKFSVYLGPCR